MITEQVKRFYEEQTGKKVKHARVCLHNIQRVLEVWKFNVEDAVIENHKDSKWNQRSNRTKLERHAACVGGNEKEKLRWWVVPKKLPTELRLSKTCQSCMKNNENSHWHCLIRLYCYHSSYPKFCEYKMEKMVEFQTC